MDEKDEQRTTSSTYAENNDSTGYYAKDRAMAEAKGTCIVINTDELSFMLHKIKAACNASTSTRDGHFEVVLQPSDYFGLSSHFGLMIALAWFLHSHPEKGLQPENDQLLHDLIAYLREVGEQSSAMHLPDGPQNCVFDKAAMDVIRRVIEWCETAINDFNHQPRQEGGNKGELHIVLREGQDGT
jgi:hypothetical protein